MRHYTLRSTIFRIFHFALIALAVPLAWTHPARASIDIPTYPGATLVSRVEYNNPDQFPSYLKGSGASFATVLKYQAARSIDLDTVASFYTHTLSKDHWTGPVKVLEGENYLVYGRDQDKIVVHVQDQGRVTALGLSFPAGSNPSNHSSLRLQQKVDNVPAGAAIHILCPAGTVVIRSHTGTDLQFDVTARADVDYPLVAEAVLKKLQLTNQSGIGGLTLSVDSSGAPDDGSTRLAYLYNVNAPVGANITIEIQKPVNPQIKIPDGNVDVSGSLGDLNISTAGPVSVSDATGKLVVNTSGPVILRNLSHDIDVHTAYWIKAYGLIVNGNVNLETSDSRIDLNLARVVDGSLKCATSNAPIMMSLPVDASADITAYGADECVGSVNFDCIDKIPGPKRWHAVVNGGKVPFELLTSGGSSGGAKVYIQNK